MKVIVIGCGTFGLNVAIEMDRGGHEVSVVDIKYKSFEMLPDSFHGSGLMGMRLHMMSLIGRMLIWSML